ncbi:MAG: hypothetical protein JW974_00075 [Alphaproteobacteria bacterium]|nr:hypothetical protein [Alphaproteobacteria bacterium]MBN2675088.1 hypothetical protein [Alphaproteobacteria bacterium]
MKKIIEFLKANKNVVIWTGSYIIVLYIILIILFGFNLFSLSNWSVLLNSRLHGFAGFTFGVIIISAIPLYISTITVIIRTKKPLFTIKFIKAKKKEKPKETKKEEKSEEEILPFPDRIPTELKGSFLRARQKTGIRPESAFDMKDVHIQKEEPEIKTSKDSGLPLPENFDFLETESPEESEENSAPVFKDINFDYNIPEKDDLENSNLIKHIKKNNYEFVIDDEVVISKGLAIITHSDSDFWIADDESWFASGKQKVSPIKKVIEAAEKHNTKPAIYLAETNIMDLDKRIEEWESKAVRIIKDLNDI